MDKEKIKEIIKELWEIEDALIALRERIVKIMRQFISLIAEKD